mgnify:CR=1 FL=1
MKKKKSQNKKVINATPTVFDNINFRSKLEVYTYDRYKGIVDTKELTYTINMHNVYPNGDGYITDMWD